MSARSMGIRIKVTDVTRPYHSLSHGEIGSTQSPTGGLRRRRRSRSSGGHVSADGSILNLSSARVRCWTPARHRLPRSSDRGVRRRSPRRGSSPTAVAGHADSAGARHRRNPPRDGTVNAGARIAIVFAAAHLVTSVRQVSVWRSASGLPSPDRRVSQPSSSWCPYTPPGEPARPGASYATPLVPHNPRDTRRLAGSVRIAPRTVIVRSHLHKRQRKYRDVQTTSDTEEVRSRLHGPAF